MAFYSQICISQIHYNKTTALIINKLKHKQNSLTRRNTNQKQRCKHLNISEINNGFIYLAGVLWRFIIKFVYPKSIV